MPTQSFEPDAPESRPCAACGRTTLPVLFPGEPFGILGPICGPCRNELGSDQVHHRAENSVPLLALVLERLAPPYRPKRTLDALTPAEHSAVIRRLARRGHLTRLMRDRRVSRAYCGPRNAHA